MTERNPLVEIVAARRRWLTVGIGVKRWLLVLLVGAFLVGMGLMVGVVWLWQLGVLPTAVYQAVTIQWLPEWAAITLPLFLGLGLIVWAVARLSLSLLAPFRLPEEGMSEFLYDYQRRNRGPKIVAIGGGTGMSGLLRGLRDFTSNITAIVTVADDGGSSGRLRRELGILPPGDFRNNIAALSRDEALMTQLLQYRFGSNQPLSEESQLKGHAFGNLLLAALVGLTGSFEEALLAAQRVLAIRGRVVPSTLSPVVLTADVRHEGKVKRVRGESAIPKAQGHIEQVYLEPENVRAYPEAVRAILQADLVVVGPGSLYTSILPNLLVRDLADALSHSTAQKVYVCNLATQPGETDNYTVADHVNVLLQHIPATCIDVVMANVNLGVPLVGEAAQTVFVQPQPPSSHRMLTADLVDEARPWRHDSGKLAEALLALLP